MTRSDLVELLAERFGQLTQRDADAAVKTILDAMSDALVRGHRIEIRGFGSFSLHFRPSRIGRNPKTGDFEAYNGKYYGDYQKQNFRANPNAKYTGEDLSNKK